MKKNLKKALAVLLAAVLVFSFAACSKKGNDSGDDNKEKTKIRYIKERFKVLKNKEVEKRKEISEAEILNEEVANEEAHFFDKNIYRDNLLEQGCSKEAIDYLKNPIHVYSYMQKYKKTEEKILDAIKKGKLRGCYVGEALWVENKKI